ncbi:MAG: T9SS type A sorting domain-containing protein [Bacteroidia bacterium]|nr:T9SS type A sorting domain-containing protein [Bacteroidia bacterium]
MYGGGSKDAFVVKLNSSGIRLWESYYGGGGEDVAKAISKDGTGSILITGFTSSTSSMATSGGQQSTYEGGNYDAFITSFSSLGLLPVKLINFDVNADNSDNHITVLCTWSTSSETNNQSFILERSFDGINFEQIVHLKGNGTTNTINYYQFKDEKIEFSKSLTTIYYKLRQVDFDGKNCDSEIKTVNLKTHNENKIKLLYDNNGVFLNIKSFPTSAITLQLFNINGSLVWSSIEVIQSADQIVPITYKGSTGLYLLMISISNENYYEKVWLK